MCGRFTLHSPKDFIGARFDVDLPELAPRYNIAPTQDILTVRARRDATEGARSAQLMRWGLIPHWAKPGAKLPLMINARVETVHTRPAYRDALRTHRCLIPADGFYEWRSNDGRKTPKTPYFLHLESGEPFAMAGLWARWREAPDAEPITSCTIVTAPANAALAPIHDRMPVILPRELEEAWLDPTRTDPDSVLELLTPVESDQIAKRIVSALVNSVEHDGPKLIEPAPDPAPSLF